MATAAPARPPRTTEEITAIRRSPEWERAKRMAKAHYNGGCAACGEPERPDLPLEVDHIRPLQFGGAPYDLDNLRVLCKPCHIRAGGGIPQFTLDEYEARNRAARERREQRAQDSVEPPRVGEGLSPAQQAAHLQDAFDRFMGDHRTIGTPRKRGRRTDRRGNPSYTAAERRAWRAERTAERVARAKGEPPPPTPLMDAYRERRREEYEAWKPEQERRINAILDDVRAEAAARKARGEPSWAEVVRASHAAKREREEREAHTIRLKLWSVLGVLVVIAGSTLACAANLI